MNKMIKNTIILTAITLVSGILLGLVYEVTKDPIKAAQDDAKKAAFQAVIPDAASFELLPDFSPENAREILGEAGYTESDIEEVANALDASGASMGYVINVVSHKGYGGDIRISVGILSDGTVTGIEMLAINETPGLGMNAAEDSFKNQFQNKQVTEFVVTKTKESGDNMIDAISGATITSNAVTNAVNSALVYFHVELGGSVQ